MMGAAEILPVVVADPRGPLFATPQWIVVLLAPLANGKTDKLPIDYRTAQVPSKGGEGAHDPAIWTTYEHARNLAQQWGPQFTVGFVLTKNDPFFCLDIDGAREAEGMPWSPLSQSLCAALPNTCIEISQSGRGLHVWGHGYVPPHSMKNVPLHIEFYTERRFIAIGHSAVGDMTLPCPTVAQFAAAYFPPRETVPVHGDGPDPAWRGPTDDAELIRRMLQSKSARSTFGGGASFADLWERKVEVLARAYPPDRSSSEPYDGSSADMALACHLAFWCGRDVARIERLMRQSALCREKWDTNAGYLVERTITNACAMQREVLQDKPIEPPPLTVDEVIDKLRDLATPSAILAAWVPLTVPLSPVERERVIQWVGPNIGAIGPQALKRELRNADEAAKRERRAAEVAAQAGDKVLIPYREEASTEAAAQIEAAIISKARPGEYLSFGGVLSHVTTKRLPDTHLIDKPDEAPPEVPQVEPLDSAAMLQRIEQAVVLHETTRDGLPRPIAVPDRIINYLIRKKTHAAPTINGLVTHPIVLGSGEILSSEGLHPASGFYLHGPEVPQVRPYSHHEAALALSRLRADFLEGFEFASPLDGDVALAGLLTGVQRRMLDAAPGLAVLASTQSSGKTTLARRIHVVLTGRDMPVSSFPVNDEAEVSKRLLSTLLRSPAAIVLDNIPDGFTFASGALAAAMTSSVFEQRVLGISRDASVPTTTLFMLTGNNLTLGNDEVTRWMVARLAPAGARPQERKFRHPDVLGRARAIRAQTLRDVVGIVAGYVHSGATCQMTGTRYPAWDRFVRQPLAWAGASDVAEVFRANADQSEPVKAHRALLWALSSLFNDQWFNATAVASATVMSDRPANTTLRSALESMKVLHVDKARSVSRALGAVDGRVGEVDGRELRLVKRLDTHTKVDIFRVERAA